MNNPETIPYFAHEGILTRMERTVRRLWIALIVVTCLMFATNVLWLYVFMQYDFETYEYSQDGRGINIIGNENGVDYGSEIESAQSNEEELERESTKDNSKKAKVNELIED